MSEQNSSNLASQTAQVAVDQALGDSTVRKALGILGADRLMGMGGAWRSRLMAERLAKKTVDGTLGQPTNEPQDQELADMKLSIGDTVHIHPDPQPRSTTTTTNTSNTQTVVRKGKVWPWVLAAALGGSAIGLVPWMLSQGGSGIDTDTDTKYKLDISSD